MRNNDKVTVICYGKETVWDSRDEAIAFYEEAMLSSEGAERDRYVNIWGDLKTGKRVCRDEHFSSRDDYDR